MAKRKKGKGKRASRRATERPERAQDPRLLASQVLEDAPGIPKGSWLLGISPAKLGDGRLVYWPATQPVMFNLVEAKRQRDRGMRIRLRVISQLSKRPDGKSFGPHNPSTMLDAISALQGAVISAFLAVESLANHAVDMLVEEVGEDLVVERPDGRKIEGRDLVRRLRLDEKLKLVIPGLEDGRPITGTSAWEGYLALKDLRDELVHVKERGVTSDPASPTAYDRLMAGEGDDCVEKALRVIDGAWPNFTPDHVRRRLA